MGKISLGLKEWLLVGGVLLLTWLALQSKKFFHKKITALHWQGKPPLPLQMIEKIFTLFVLYLSAVTIFQIVGFDIWPLLTLSGIGAAVLGFACRDLLANFLGGVMIHMTSPFSLEEWIELPGKKIEGKVQEIGWYFTTLQDPQRRSFYVPNALFAAEFLSNHSRVTHRRIQERIWVRERSSTQVEAIIQEMRAWMESCEGIDVSEPRYVSLKSIHSWGVEVEVEAYTTAIETAKFLEIKNKILFAMYSLMQQQRGERETAREKRAIPRQ